jgi:transposase
MMLPDPDEVRLVTLTPPGDGIVDVVATTVPQATCPACGPLAERIRSRSVRQVADLPWQGVAVRLRLPVRRLFGDQPRCPRAKFTEPSGSPVSSPRTGAAHCAWPD